MQPLFGDMFDQARLKAAGDEMVKHLQEMQENASASTRARAEEVVDFWKAFFSVKSVDDLQKLQNHVAKSIENSVGDTKKAAASFKSLAETAMKSLKPVDKA